MPKQIIEINPFHGGMNNNTDPRDLQHDELSKATNVMVDRIGRIRCMGSSTSHVSGTADSGTVTAQGSGNHGYNLFSFRHDMKSLGHYDVLFNGITNQNSGSYWTVNGDISKNATNFIYNRSAGNGGYLEQTAANRKHGGLNSHKYILKIDISGYSHGSGSAQLVLNGGSGYFASADKNIFNNGSSLDDMQGVHLIEFTSHSAASTGVFRITVSNFTAASGDEMTINSLECYPIPSDDGEDYLMLRTSGGGDEISTYHYSTNLWNNGILALDNDEARYIFWQVDGNIRISDANKYGDNLEYNNWIGYVNRLRFSNNGVKTFSDSTPSVTAWQTSQTHYSVNQTSTSGDGSHIKVKIVTDGSGNPTITIPKPSGANIYYGGTGYEVGDTIVFTDPGSTSNTATVTVASIQQAGHEINRWINTECKLHPPTDTNIVIENTGSGPYDPTEGYLVFSSQWTGVRENSGTWNANGASGTANGGGSNFLTTSTDVFTSAMVGARISRTGGGSYSGKIVSVETAQKAYTDGTITWANTNTFTIGEAYNIGFTWVYDENQESLIHDRFLFAPLGVPNASLSFGVIAGHYWDTKDTARITGANMYYKKETDSTNTWYHLYEIDLERGGRETFAIEYNSWIASDSKADTNYEYQIDGGVLIENPPTAETFNSRNGYDSDPTNLLDIQMGTTTGNNTVGYSCAVVANRVAYIANIAYKNSNGFYKNHGDLMLKSVVNKFDTFPLSRRLEVSVQDGDEITALASYADRLLQYKKNKMHLINISQEVEFLEDTFEFKGVLRPAAVCKTDFGIAWVNNFGCYLYDGRQVHNLLEQKGVRKISTNSWFTSDDIFSQIAYLPLQRQIVIHRSSEGRAGEDDGDIFIYDMVTKSWVFGTAIIQPSSGGYTTNLITDKNGDLIWSFGNGVVKKWNNSSSESSVKIITADMNYGDSGVRKKVYRVRLSYKGDASSLNVRYSTNGDTNTYKQFEGTSSGLPNGSATNAPLENKSSDVTQWHHAELKPAVSSEATNIYSFQVHMTGTAGATFEINDLSVVFRIKNVK